MTISQLKKAVDKIEFSPDSKKKINNILTGAKKAGGLSESAKEELLNEIGLDADRDLMEAKGCDIVLKGINKIIS